jgi:hypothetical protein
VADEQAEEFDADVHQSVLALCPRLPHLWDAKICAGPLGENISRWEEQSPARQDLIAAGYMLAYWEIQGDEDAKGC